MFPKLFHREWSLSDPLVLQSFHVSFFFFFRDGWEASRLDDRQHHEARCPRFNSNVLRPGAFPTVKWGGFQRVLRILLQKAKNVKKRSASEGKGHQKTPAFFSSVAIDAVSILMKLSSDDLALSELVQSNRSQDSQNRCKTSSSTIGCVISCFTTYYQV